MINHNSDDDLERVARIICRMRGIDPDGMIAHGARPTWNGGEVPSIMLYSRAWQLIANEAKEWLQVWKAMHEAISDKIIDANSKPEPSRPAVFGPSS